MDDSAIDDFYEKFDGYTIPRKRKSEQKTPDVVGQGLASPYQGAVEKYPKLQPHSPSKHPKKISRKSARDFLSNEDDSYRFSAPKNDPLGLSTPMTYGEARGEKWGKPLEKWLDQYDGQLPVEIVSKCSEDQCALCNVSFITQGCKDAYKIRLQKVKLAEMHYFGTPHEKKINLALNEWKTADPVNRIIPTKKTSVPKDNFNNSNLVNEVDMTYCHVCQIQLTSKMTAQAHYTGAKHVKNVKKAGSGITIVGKETFGASFKSSPEKKKPKLISDVLMADESAREGSGNRFFCMGCKLHFSEGFKYQQHLASNAHKAKSSEKSEFRVENTTPQSDKSMFEIKKESDQAGDGGEGGFSSNYIDEMLSKIRADPKSVYDCTICKVQCNTQEVLNVHLQGSKHKKKLVSLSNTQTKSQFHCEICNVECAGQEPYDMHLAGKKHQKKISAMT